MVMQATLTLDEFLAMPETEPPCEYVQGRVIQKPMPTFLHGLIQSRLGYLIARHLEQAAGAFVVSEVRHADRDEDRAYLPDVAVIRATRISDEGGALPQGALTFPPDIAIEVLSPDARPGRVSDKVSFYLRTGTEIVWLIDPEERTLTEHRRGGASRIYDVTGSVSAAPVLPGFKLEMAELFAIVPAGE